MTDDKISTLIRDATAVGSISKSEFRRRLDEIIQEEKDKLRAWLTDCDMEEQDDIQENTDSLEEKLEALDKLEFDFSDGGGFCKIRGANVFIPFPNEYIKEKVVQIMQESIANYQSELREKVKKVKHYDSLYGNSVRERVIEDVLEIINN